MGGHPCSFPFRGPLHPSDCLLSPSGAPFILQTVFFPLEGPPSSFRLSSFPLRGPLHPSDHLLSTGDLSLSFRPSSFPFRGPLSSFRPSSFPWGPPFILQSIFFPLGTPLPPSDRLFSPGGTLSILQRVLRLLRRGLHASVRMHRFAPLETTMPPLLGWRRHRSQDP